MLRLSSSCAAVMASLLAASTDACVGALENPPGDTTGLWTGTRHETT